MMLVHTVANIALLPSSLAHELTHAAVAKPWAERVELDLHLFSDGRPEMTVEWCDGVARWQVALVSLAPLIAGMIALAVALVLWVFGGLSMPSGVSGLATVSIAAMWWVLYVVPSPADVNTAMNGGKPND